MSKSAIKKNQALRPRSSEGRAAEGHFRETKRLALSSEESARYLGNGTQRRMRAYGSGRQWRRWWEKQGSIVDARDKLQISRSERSLGTAYSGLRRAGQSNARK